MSLQLAAQHLSSHGRGNDSTLVHMSPREVGSLNALAKAHGGQLTTNPHTGLPEAGFLESLLPMVAGVALGPAGLGLTAMEAGLAGGALGFAMTGSLSKGLMAGMGAYGGAGLGGGLLESGVDAAATTDAASQAAQSQIAENAANAKFYDPSGALNPAMKDEYIKAQLAGQNQAMAAREALKPTDFMDKLSMAGKGISSLGEEGGISNLYKNLGGSPMSMLKTVGSAIAPSAENLLTPKKKEATAGDSDLGPRYGFSQNPTGGQQPAQQVQPGQSPLGNTQTPTATPFPQFPQPDPYGRENRYFSPAYTQLTPEKAKSIYGFADGGIAAEDRPTETPAVQMFQQLQAQRAAQAPAPQVDINAQYANYLKQTMGSPAQAPTAPTSPAPTSTSLASSGYAYDPIQHQYSQIQGALPDETSDSVGQPIRSADRPFAFTFANGGISSHLGDYSDGGRLLRGPGDGVSDSIPAMIGKKQPARLADGEFVVPARIVSELGNGSTEAGARKLYAMMDRVQAARGKTVGKGKVAKNSRSDKYLPA
jgi:hypothetical protein